MQRILSMKQTVGDLFSEYCSSGATTGWERFGWIVILLASMYGCSMLIRNIYSDWNERPIILSVNDRMTPTSEILFPTVTICPEATHRLETLDFEALYKTFTNAREQLSSSELETIQSLLQICEHIDIWPLDVFQAPANFPSVLLSVFPNVTPIYSVKKGAEFQLDKILTEQGVCFATNSMGPARQIFRRDNVDNLHNFIDKWMNDTDPSFLLQTNISFYLWDYSPTGNSAGLRMSLKIPTFYAASNQCRKPNGFKVMLNAQVEYPLWSEKYFHLATNHKMSIAIKPDIMVTSEELRGYPPAKRKCYFSDEIQLKFFTIYTRYNCQLEKFVNLTKSLTACGEYWMPRDNSTPVCTNRHVHSSARYYTMISKDPCLPACNSIEYSVDFVQTSYLPPEPNQEYNVVELEVYFDRSSYMGLKRSELYGLTEFIANCGGALGLCMGVSLLSLVELAYYCLMRPLTKAYRCGRQGVVMVEPLQEVWMTGGDRIGGVR